MPVINLDRELIGLITMKDVNMYFKNKQPIKESVKDFMTTELIVTHQFETLEKAKEIMIKNEINSLPVVKNNKLIGIITTNDF